MSSNTIVKPDAIVNPIIIYAIFQHFLTKWSKTQAYPPTRGCWICFNHFRQSNTVKVKARVIQLRRIFCHNAVQRLERGNR